MKRVNTVTSESTYILAEFTSALFRFMDDVKFFCDDATKTIHFRSASRVGYSDLGINRNRVEEIRTRKKFGDFLEFQSHCHVLCTDGCFYGKGVFRMAPRFNPECSWGQA